MWNKHSKLVVVWAGLDIFHFSSSILCFLFVSLWRGIGPVAVSDDDRLLRRFAVNQLDAYVAVALGCLLFINAIWSVIAFITSRRPAASTRPLSIFNASLVTMILITLLVGTFIWFQSLRQVQEYAQVFRALDPLAQGYIQDRLECCGYFNATIDGIFTSSTGFCTPDAIPSRDQTTNQGCMVSLVAYSESTLNNVFSTVYGMVVVQLLLFLATACLQIDKIEQKRFERIEEKRGAKGGFV